MTNNEYIERYVYAVTKRMPENQKNDVAEELRTLIDDMLAQRCGEVTPTEKDVKVVLTELGTPNKLAASYDMDGKKCLIGQPYYSTYIFVLKTVLICVVVGMTIVGIITNIINIPSGEFAKSIALAIAEVLANIFSGAVSAFTTVTLLFAIFYHFNVDLGTTDSIDNLPPIPKKSETISKGECIFGISVSIIFLSVFLLAPQIFCIIKDKQVIPIFNVEVVKSTWYFIIAFGILGILREVVKLMEGRYTNKVLLTTAVTDILSGILTAFWLLKDNIISPQFIQNFADIFADKEMFIIRIFANFQYFLLGFIILALALDIIETAIKTVRAK